VRSEENERRRAGAKYALLARSLTLCAPAITQEQRHPTSSLLVSTSKQAGSTAKKSKLTADRLR